MKRRDFLRAFAVPVIAVAAETALGKAAPLHLDSAWYRHQRRFVDLPMARVAYVENGQDPAALFIHGYPLNGYQWRGALARFQHRRRCIAPDVMGLGSLEDAPTLYNQLWTAARAARARESQCRNRSLPAWTAIRALDP